MFIVWLSGWCWWGGSGSGSGESPSQTPPPASPPISSVPTTGSALIELGPIAGGSIRFQSLSGVVLWTGWSASDGSLVYSPRDIISKIGNDLWVLAFVYGWQDTDADDDGIADVSPTGVNGSFFVYIPREQIEQGRKIIIGPRAGAITESILGRSNAVFSKEILNNIARETGAKDTNGDGVTDYTTDVLETQMKNIPDDDVSGIVPAVSGYIRSVHTGDSTQKQSALEKIAKTENHIIATIIADPGWSHLPALKLKSISGDILYTLDLSSPLPNNSSTKIASGEVTLPFWGGKLYYRERYTLGGKTILGKVRGFDLTTDWTELSETGISYNTSGSEKQTLEGGVYKDINYTIITSTNKISPGYTYPKFIGCTVGGPGNAGCDFGPYLAWSPEHENAVRQIMLTAIKTYIDTPSGTVPIPPIVTPPPVVTPPPIVTPPSPALPSHPQNQSISITGKVENYYGGWYEVYNQWNLNGTSDFPVKIIGNYSTQSGWRQPNMEQMAYTEAERQSKTTWMVIDVQDLLAADYKKLPPPTYPPNHEIHSGWISYRGYAYDMVTTMNIQGNSDYPASVYANYTTPSGSAKTTSYWAHSAADLPSTQTGVINEAKAHIDLLLDADLYLPNYKETITPTTAYGGGSYSTTFTYSENLHQDYPGYIEVQTRFRDGSTQPWTFQASDSNQKALWILQGEARAREDIDNYNPTYGNMELKSEGPYTYGSRWSIYTIYARYNNNHENKNYPAKIWIEYRSGANGSLQNTWNTYGQTWANTSVEKEQIKATLEQWVRWQMVAYGSLQKEKETPFEFPTFGLISTAYALPPTSSSSILVKQNPATLNTILNGNTWQSSFFTKGTTQTIYTQKQEKKPSVSGMNQTEIQKKLSARIAEELHKYENAQVWYLWDIPENMRKAIEGVFLDLGKYNDNLPWLVAKHYVNLINAWVPIEVINNMWTKIGDIWEKSAEPLGQISSFDIALTLSWWLTIKYVVSWAWRVITKLISWPWAEEYLKYEASLMLASGGVWLWPGTVKLLSSAMTVEQLQAISIAKTIPGITRLGGGASVLYGSAEDVELLLSSLMKNWWKLISKNTAADGTKIFLYESWDGLSRVWYRVISASQFNWYTVSATLDLSKKVGDNFVRLGSPAEIKFISPNYFNP